MGFIMLPLVLPEVIVAISLLVVLMQLGLDSGLWSIILGHTLLCIPFSIAILQGSFSNMDQSLEEAAIDLGETPFSTFRLVTLPLVAPGIVASLLICFTISLDEFIIAFFLSGNAPTLPVYLWGQLRFPARLPMIMALGTILVVLSIVLADRRRNLPPPRPETRGREGQWRVPVRDTSSDHGAGARDHHAGACREVLRRVPRAARHLRRDPAGRVLFAAGPLGLRQDHASARHRGVRGYLGGHHPARRARTWRAWRRTSGPPTSCSSPTPSSRI
jgi:hypothetical protein